MLAGFREILSARLAVSNREIEIHLMAMILIRDTRLRVEEMVMACSGERLQILVIDAADVITYIAVLQIAVQRQFPFLFVDDSPVRFGVDIAFCLHAVAAVELLCSHGLIQVIRYQSPVIAHVMATGATDRQVGRFRAVVDAENPAVVMVVQVFVTDKIGLLDHR